MVSSRFAKCTDFDGTSRFLAQKLSVPIETGIVPFSTYCEKGSYLVTKSNPLYAVSRTQQGRQKKQC